MEPTGRHAARQMPWLLKAIRGALFSVPSASHGCSKPSSFGKDTLLEHHLFFREALWGPGCDAQSCGLMLCYQFDLGESHSEQHLEAQHQILQKIKEFTHGQSVES